MLSGMGEHQPPAVITGFDALGGNMPSLATLVDEAGAVTVTFKAEVVAGADMGRGLSHVGPKLVLSAYQVDVLEMAREPRSPPELMAPSGLKNKTRFRDQVVAPLLEAGLLEMTVPDKPRSSRQQYRTTAAGLALVRGKD
jgi:hypothetical protein